MEMVLTCRRIDGRFLTTYLTETETGRVVVTVPCDFWRKGRPRPEIGGAVPKPSLSEGMVPLPKNNDVWFHRARTGYRLHLVGGASLEVADAGAAIEALCQLVDLGLLGELERIEKIL